MLRLAIDGRRRATFALCLAAACGDDTVPPLPAASATATETASGPDGDGAIGEGPDDGASDDDRPNRGGTTTSGAPVRGDTSSHSDNGDSTSVADADAGTDASGDASSGEGSSSTGEAVDPVPALAFVDVALEAGVHELHGMFMMSPNCLIDQLGPGVGGFCISERMTGGVAVGDFNDDAWPDLFVSRTYGNDRLYRNNADGTFTDVAEAMGVPFGQGTSGAIWADIDNDGDQDLYITRIGDTRYYLLINHGTHFTEEAIARGAALKSLIQHSPMGVATGDYDLDGYLDLYVAEWKTNAGVSKEASHSRLLHNLGAGAPGHFEDVTDDVGVNVDQTWTLVGALPGTYSFSPSFADLDGDDFPDLTVVSDFRCSRLFWNNGDGTFVDGTFASGAGVDRNGMGSTMGDYDGDGDLDWFITSITTPTGLPENRMLRNLGNREFSDLAVALGVGSGGWGWGTSFLDADNDADLDLLMTAGYYYTSYLNDKNQLWLNDGDGTFSPDVAPQIGLSSDTDGQGRGLATLDFDRDGDMDVMLVNNNAYPNLLRNDTVDAGDWLVVRAVGTLSNRDGIGAKISVRAVAGGPTQVREVGTMAQYMGQGSRDTHFGVGWGDAPLAEVRVYFPRSGIEHVLVDVDRNQRIEVVE